MPKRDFNKVAKQLCMAASVPYETVVFFLENTSFLDKPTLTKSCHHIYVMVRNFVSKSHVQLLVHTFHKKSIHRATSAGKLFVSVYINSTSNFCMLPSVVLLNEKKCFVCFD